MAKNYVNVHLENFGLLAICAIRYCQGRQTYMPSMVQDIIKTHIKDITNRDLATLIEDCKFQERMNLYGDEHIDKPKWLEFRLMLINEKMRRSNL